MDRWQRMIEKYGSEEAARVEMSRRAATSSRNKGGDGGFASMSPERRKEIAQLGVNARREKKTKN